MAATWGGVAPDWGGALLFLVFCSVFVFRAVVARLKAKDSLYSESPYLCDRQREVMLWSLNLLSFLSSFLFGVVLALSFLRRQRLRYLEAVLFSIRYKFTCWYSGKLLGPLKLIYSEIRVLVFYSGRDSVFKYSDNFQVKLWERRN